MSVIKNNLSRLSSFHSLKNLSNNNSKQSNFGIFSFKGKRNQSKFGLFNSGFNETSNSSKDKNNKLQNINKSTSKLLKIKEEQNKVNKGKYPNKSYKFIIKYIRNNFINKYNIAYYEFSKSDNMYNKKNHYLLYDYYKINDLIENKKCSLVAKYNEFKITSNKKELLIRFYKPKERYMIMKYLLNFVYKFDKLCFDISKEIPDLETKEQIIKTFYYITSEQYNYEHLFDNDSFKGVQNLLKYVNLASKKASYDYSYLDMTKNTNISKENEIIINTMKVINEYIINSNYLQKKLIKNFPIETVPNIVPNYFPLGIKINICLNDYRFQRKYIKIENHEETKELIKKYKKEFLKEDDKNLQRNNFNKSLFKIQENKEENESGKSGVSSENYRPNKNKIELDYKIIFTESMKENTQITKSKDYSHEIRNTKENELQNNLIMEELNQNLNANKRDNEDPEERDIEKLLNIIPNDFKKINYNIKNELKINDSILHNKKRNFPKVKFRLKPSILKNESLKNEEDKNIKKLHNQKKFVKISENNKVFEITNSTKHTGLSIFNEASYQLNQRKVNNKYLKNHLINSPSFNNISSSNFNDTNYINSNLSTTNKINKNKINYFLNGNKNQLSI